VVNDGLGTRLAEIIGLPVAAADILDVHPWLIEHSPELRIELCGRQTMITSGLSFGSRYVVSLAEGEVYDYLPGTMIERVRNLSNFAGILPFDKWTCNADGRQAAFWKRLGERKFIASSIDQGYCFHAGERSFRMRRCAASLAVDRIQSEWYDSAADELGQLQSRLLERRTRVRDLIVSFKKASRDPFPNWSRLAT
jgi:hypothetical protein